MIVDIAIKTISHLGVEMKAAAFYVKLYYKQEFKIRKSILTIFFYYEVMLWNFKWVSFIHRTSQISILLGQE